MQAGSSQDVGFRQRLARRKLRTRAITRKRQSLPQVILHPRKTQRSEVYPGPFQLSGKLGSQPKSDTGKVPGLALLARECKTKDVRCGAALRSRYEARTYHRRVIGTHRMSVSFNLACVKQC